MAIKSVRIWKSDNKSDARVYVKNDAGQEGCLYVTGNKWNAKGSKTGDLDDSHWQEAKSLAFREGSWYNWYAPYPSAAPTSKAVTKKMDYKSSKCPDCGGYYCSPMVCDSGRGRQAYE